jgi:hypothetical protein
MRKDGSFETPRCHRSVRVAGIAGVARRDHWRREPGCLCLARRLTSGGVQDLGHPHAHGVRRLSARHVFAHGLVPIVREKGDAR